MGILENVRRYLTEASAARERIEDLGYVPTPLKTIKRIVEEQPRLSGLLPYAAYVPEERVFINDDSIGFCLEMRPQVGGNEEMARILTSLFLNCPTGTGIQVIEYASPNLVAINKQYANIRALDADHQEQAQRHGRPVRNNNIFRQIVRERIEYYRRGERHSVFSSVPYLFRNFRLIISVTIPGTGTAEEIKTLLRLRETYKSTLQSAQFRAIEWEVTDLMKFLSEVLNPQAPYHDRMPAYDDGRLIKAQVVNRDTVCRVEPSGLLFSDASAQTCEVRTYSVRNYPEINTLWEMGVLTGDPLQATLQYPCPFLFMMGVYILDYEKSKAQAQMKSARATANAGSQMAKFLPDIATRKKDWDIVMRSLSDGQAIVSLYHQLVLFTQPGQAQQAEHAAMSIFRAKNFELTNDVYMQPQALLSSLPMTLSKDMYSDLRKAGRVSTKTGDNAVHLAPMMAEWWGTSTPTIRMFGRRGQVMNLDVFDNTAGNYNVCIAAASGAGKSVFLQEIAMSYLGTGGRGWTIDVGRSYERLCRLIGGQFIEFKPDIRICLNPFSNINDIDEEMSVIRPVVEQMAMPNAKCDALQKALIEEAIRAAWGENGNDMTITDVARHLEINAKRTMSAPSGVEDLAERLFPTIAGTEGAPASAADYATLLMAALRQERNQGADQRVLDLAKMLYPFTREGAYGRYFDGRANIAFQSEYVVLELEELNVKKDLQGVVLLILMLVIQQAMYLGERNQRKLLMIDEAWDLMGAGATAAFMETAARRLRKYGAALLTATQSVSDYYNNEAATAILNNSDWLCLLRQKPEAVAQLASSGRLVLTEGQRQLLASVRTEHGAYSEVFVYSPMGVAVGRPMLDPFSEMLYTTRAEEYTAIHQRLEAGMDMIGAIRDVLKMRGKRNVH